MTPPYGRSPLDTEIERMMEKIKMGAIRPSAVVPIPMPRISSWGGWDIVSTDNPPMVEVPPSKKQLSLNETVDYIKVSLDLLRHNDDVSQEMVEVIHAGLILMKRKMQKNLDRRLKRK